MLNLSTFKNVDRKAVVSLAALLSFLALYALRSADDNRLFSWRWMFDRFDAFTIVLLIVPGIVVAYILSNVTLPERNPRAFLFLFSYLAAALFWTEPELFMDASRYFTQAKHLEVYGVGYFIREWGGDITAWTDLPVVPFLYGLIFSLFGEHRVLIQAFVTLLFSTTLVLTYLVGKTLWDEDTGFAGGMLLLGMPLLLMQVPLMLVDVPTMFFLALSVFTFLKALDHGGARWTGCASLALLLAAFSKYSAWMLLTVLPVIFFVRQRKAKGTTFRRALAVALLSGGLIGAVVAIKFGVFAEQARLLMNYQQPGLERWGESFFSTFFFHVHPFITLAAVASLGIAWRRRDWNYAVICWLVLLVLLFGIRRSRYILPALPMLALMASYGLQRIEQKGVRRFIVYLTVMISLVTAVFAYLPFARSTSAVNVKDAGQYLNSRGIEVVEVFTLPLRDPVVNPSVAVPLLDLFTSGTIRYQYEAGLFPPPEDIKTNALRFTWEFKDLAYYGVDPAPMQRMAIVVISGEPTRTVPPDMAQRIRGYSVFRRFETPRDPFRYKTIVDVYSRQ
jgi:4-amino-4-deoxy-L-arabinose transferase-like glycosyltransferase